MGKGTLDNYLNNAKKLSKTVDQAVLLLEDEYGRYKIVLEGDFLGNSNWFLVAAFRDGEARMLP